MSEVNSIASFRSVSCGPTAETPSIDGITASGDNISVEHNDGQVYRIKPRTNLEVNRHWITDEVRYGWKFVHGDARIDMPRVRDEEPYEPSEAPVAYDVCARRMAPSEFKT